MATISEKALAEEVKQVVLFQLIDENTKEREHFAAGIEQIKEIRVLDTITNIPQTPDHVTGVMNLRGKIITIVDTKRKIGMPTSEQIKLDSHILVSEIEGNQIGLLVDEVAQVIQIPVKDIQPPPSHADNVKYVKGIIQINKNLVLLIDLNELLKHEVDLSKVLNKEKSENV